MTEQFRPGKRHLKDLQGFRTGPSQLPDWHRYAGGPAGSHQPTESGSGTPSFVAKCAVCSSLSRPHDARFRPHHVGRQSTDWLPISRVRQ